MYLNKETVVKESRDSLSPNAQTFEERKQQLNDIDEIEKRRLKEKTNSPFSNFLQINNSDEAFEREHWLITNNATAYKLWRFLAKHMDNYNAVMVSYQVLTEVFEVSRTTIYRAIKFLEDNKYIKITKSGTSNVYALDDSLVWKSWGKNKKYSKFSANIIVSETEQDEQIQKEIKIKTQNQRSIVKE